MVVVLVVNGELAEIGAIKLATATPTNPWKQLQRLFPVALFAVISCLSCLSHDTVETITACLVFLSLHLGVRQSL